MTDFKNLEQFARHVRREAAYLMTALCEDLGADHPSTLRALALVTTAAELAKEQREGYGVAEPILDPERYDLAALTSWVTPAREDEGPFAGE